MKNDFQKLVDRELSGLCWNERMRQKVLHSLDEEEKPVKKKMTVGMALALVLVLVGSLAVAAGMMFSPRYDVLKMADDALCEAYSISDDLLPFFGRMLNESEGIVTYRAMEDLRSVIGDYTVTIENGSATAKWSLDGVEGAWNAEKLVEINQICKQQGGYAEVYAMARADEDKYHLAASAASEMQTSAEENVLAVMEKQEKESEMVKAAAKLTVSEMDQTGRAALKERFGLNDQQVAKLELEDDSCAWYIKNNQKLFSLYYWLWQNENEWVEGNGIYIVDVNVETGAVEEIYYDNGLLGNG